MTPKERYGIDPAEMTAIKRDDLQELRDRVKKLDVLTLDMIGKVWAMEALLQEALEELDDGCTDPCVLCGGALGAHKDKCIVSKIREFLVHNRGMI